MKKVLTIFLIAIFNIGVFGQVLDLSNYGVSIKPDKRLIAVLVSLEAAGTETTLSKKGEEFRTTLQEDLSEVDPELRQKMKIFVDQYAKRLARRYRADLVSQESNETIRKEVLEDFDSFFAKYSRGLNEEEKNFYYKKYGSFIRQIKAPFISMAYSLSPAPELEEPSRSLDLPDDLLEVLDFSVFVRQLYRSKGMPDKSKALADKPKAMADNIDSYYKMNQEIGDNMRKDASEMVRDVLDYLHTRPELTFKEKIKVDSKRSRGKGKKEITTYETVYRERSFQIVPDMLASKGTINFLNIKDNYFAIVPPDTDLSSSEVRRGFLQFVLDPLVLKSSKNILLHQEEIKNLLNERRNAGASVSPDPFLAISRSLVAAVDAKERQFRKQTAATDSARRNISLKETDAEKKEIVAGLNKFNQIFSDEAILQLSESYKNGAVLAFYFAEKLEGIENSGFDIANSLDDWIFSLKPNGESGRLTQNRSEIIRAIAQREKEGTTFEEVTTFVDNPLTLKLLKVEKLSEAKKFDEAEEQLKQLLEENKDNSIETARIYYALGRMVSQSAEGVKDLETVNRLLIKAKGYYEKVFNSASQQTDPGLISSTYFALGRIYEFSGQTEYAIKIYDAALKLGEVPGGAWQEAFEAKNALIRK